LTQDRDDLRLSASACLHTKSPHASCRENSTHPAPYFREDYRISGVGLAGVGLVGAKNLSPQNSQAASKIVQSRRLHVSRRTLKKH
jgi:hypothetical protein